jgi:cytochrome c-type biogenesis protein
VNLSLSFITGMLAAVNPCGFVLLPTYLLYFLGISNAPNADGTPQRAPITRALTVSAAVSAGFLVVFLVIGTITRFFTNWIAENAKYLTGGIGLLLVLLGAAMLFGYRLPISTPKLDTGGKDRTVWSMFLYGIAYAVASIGCSIALFSGVLFGTARREGFAAGVLSVVFYGLGMALVVSALTVSLAVANKGLLRLLRSGLQYVETVAGAFVLVAGLYLVWYFWRVDVLGEGDPITDAVGRWQSELQAFLNDHWGAVAVVLALIVGGAVVASLAVRRRRPDEVAATRTDAHADTDTVAR